MLRRTTNAWRRFTKAWIHGLHRGTETPPEHPPEGWCPLCAKQRPSSCPACRGAQAQPELQTNIDTYTRRRAFADQEVLTLIGHLRYASPKVRTDFQTLLREILAEDLAKDGNGSAFGAGYIFGDIINS